MACPPVHLFQRLIVPLYMGSSFPEHNVFLPLPCQFAGVSTDNARNHRCVWEQYSRFVWEHLRRESYTAQSCLSPELKRRFWIPNMEQAVHAKCSTDVDTGNTDTHQHMEQPNIVPRKSSSLRHMLSTEENELRKWEWEHHWRRERFGRRKWESPVLAMIFLKIIYDFQLYTFH